MHTAANSSQPALPFPIPLWYWGASPWFTLCLSAHLAFFSHLLSLPRTSPPGSHSLSLICFSVWQSKHCPSDTSPAIFPSVEMGMKCDLTGGWIYCMLPYSHPWSQLSVWVSKLICFYGTSDQRCRSADPQQQVARSCSHHQSANKAPYK